MILFPPTLYLVTANLKPLISSFQNGSHLLTISFSRRPFLIQILEYMENNFTELCVASFFKSIKDQHHHNQLHGCESPSHEIFVSNLYMICIRLYTQVDNLMRTNHMAHFPSPKSPVQLRLLVISQSHKTLKNCSTIQGATTRI